MSKLHPIATVAALCAGLTAFPVNASEPTDAWQYRAYLDLFLPAMGGSTTFPEPGAGVSVDVSKILNALKMAFMGGFEASRGGVGVYTDILYMDLGNTKSGTGELRFNGLPFPVDVGAVATFDLKGTAWTLAGAYGVARTAALTVDLTAGTRLLDIKQTLDWQLSGNIGSVPLPGRSGVRSADVANWDAIVGAKGRYAIGEERRWFTPFYIDVGTGESKLTWQIMAGVGYGFQWGEVIAWWRLLDFVMKSGSKVESL